MLGKPLGKITRISNQGQTQSTMENQQDRFCASDFSWLSDALPGTGVENLAGQHHAPDCLVSSSCSARNPFCPFCYDGH